MRDNPIKAVLKAAPTSLSLIVVVAFAMRVGFVWMAKHHAPTPFFDFPYGYETGHIARSIALGKGFSSPLNGVDTGPTAWLTPVFPYLLAGVFKLFGIYTYTSFLVIVTIDCLFSALACVPDFLYWQALGRAGNWSDCGMDLGALSCGDHHARFLGLGHVPFHACGWFDRLGHSRGIRIEAHASTGRLMVCFGPSG